jgi:hypothetical protein
MRRSLLLAALAAAATATPAAAAGIAQLDCPNAAMSPAQREALAEAAAAMPHGSDPRLAPLRETAQACARRLRWSPAATNSAIAYHAAAAGVAQLRRRLAADGVDVAPLENALLADRALFDALGPGGNGETPMSTFLARHQAIIERTIGGRAGDVQERVGNFAGFLVAMQAMRVRFVAN